VLVVFSSGESGGVSVRKSHKQSQQKRGDGRKSDGALATAARALRATEEMIVFSHGRTSISDIKGGCTIRGVTLTPYQKEVRKLLEQVYEAILKWNTARRRAGWYRATDDTTW